MAPAVANPLFMGYKVGDDVSPLNHSGRFGLQWLMRSSKPA